MRRNQRNSLTLVVILGVDERLPVAMYYAQRLELANAVVTSREAFNGQFAHSRLTADEMLGQQRHQRLRTVHQSLHFAVSVRGLRILRQVVDTTLGLGIGLPARDVEQRLVKIRVADLTRQVRNCRVTAAAHFDQAVENLAKLFIGGIEQRADVPQATVEDRQDGRNLLLDPGVRPVHPQQRLFKLSCRLQVIDAVMPQRAPEIVQKMPGQAPALLLQVVHVREQRLLLRGLRHSRR